MQAVRSFLFLALKSFVSGHGFVRANKTEINPALAAAALVRSQVWQANSQRLKPMHRKPNGMAEGHALTRT
jgi:hypothetical protein